MGFRASTGRGFHAYKWGCAGLSAAAQSTIYFAVGRARLPRSTELLRTRWDDAIPFLPVTAWCYLPVYFSIFALAVAGLRSRHNFNRALCAFGFIMLTGLAGHLLVNATYPRPVLQPPFATLSERFLAWVQSIDPPGNVFPSLHVAHTSSLALFLHHENPRLGSLVMVLALVLALSTLTTKQHFIADVISGLALAALAYRLFSPRRADVRADSARPF